MPPSFTHSVTYAAAFLLKQLALRFSSGRSIQKTYMGYWNLTKLSDNKSHTVIMPVRYDCRVDINYLSEV